MNIRFGTPGERKQNIRVTCKGFDSFEGHYGVNTIIHFEHSVNDTDKVVLVGFASGDQHNEWAINTEYTIDATIMAHDNYGKRVKINRIIKLEG